MIRLLDRLNLRPNERRFVVAVFLVVFLVLNIFFVWPHFQDWADAGRRMDSAEKKLKSFNAEILQMADYQKRIKTFENQNPNVPPEDQSLQFVGTIQQQAVASSVGVLNTGTAKTATNNAFFLEHSRTITIQSREEPLVNFLYSLGAGESLIRVRELSLRPDAPRQNLGGTITLVASYQRKTPSKTPSPAARPASAAAAPAASKSPAASAAKTAPAAAGKTNAPGQSGSIWSKVKGWFGPSPGKATRGKTNTPAAKSVPKPPSPPVPGIPGQPAKQPGSTEKKIPPPTPAKP